jgi:hypothetical protein
MRYIDVNWLHDLQDEPYRLVSEMGSDDFETRKLEFFRNGEVGLATDKMNTKKTMLGLVEVPTLEEINSQEEFQGTAITQQDFEILWGQYAPSSS